MKEQWILLAEGDQNDADLVLRAWAANQPQPGDEIVIARDGSEVMDCLYRRNSFRTRNASRPALLLLDLDLPKLNGLEVLRRIKTDWQLRTIPVVVFTSSREETDLSRCYQLGANAYVVKPDNFSEFTAAITNLRTFWMRLNEPSPESRGANRPLVAPSPSAGWGMARRLATA